MDPRIREWIGGICMLSSIVMMFVGGFGFMTASEFQIQMTFFGLAPGTQYRLGLFLFVAGFGVLWVGRVIATDRGDRKSYWYGEV